MEIAHFYVEHWEIMREENIGYLLWGKVGTGKSYFGGCIANALMEQEVAVRMTNFSAILNDLTASFEAVSYTHLDVYKRQSPVRTITDGTGNHFLVLLPTIDA